MKTIPKLKVAADPRYPNGHPFHQSRYIVTEDTVLIAEMDVPHGDGEKRDIVLLDENRGAIVARMTDCEHQVEYARLFAAALDLLQVAEAVVAIYEKDKRAPYGGICDSAIAAIAKAKGGHSNTPTTTPPTIEERVAEELGRLGIIAYAEGGGSGCPCVSIPTAAPFTWNFGTANANWGGDLVHDKTGSHLEGCDLEVNSDSEDAELIAEKIAEWVRTRSIFRFTQEGLSKQ